MPSHSARYSPAISWFIFGSLLAGVLLSSAPAAPVSSSLATATPLRASLPSAPSVPTPSGPLPANSSFDFAFDAADGYDVYLGASDAQGGPSPGSPALGVTWTFFHGNWTQLDLTVAPPYARSVPMAYDPARGQLILVTQGRAGTETWGFSGGSWSNLTPTLPVEPPNAPNSATAWDATSGTLLLYGSLGSNETWALGATAWAQVTTPHSPPSLEGPALASDPSDGGVLLFGGAEPAGGGSLYWSNQTWLFAGGSWHQIPSGPAGRIAATMAYDPSRRSVVLFGGITNTAACAAVGGYGDPTTYLNDTWAHRGGVWTPLGTNVTADRAWAEMTLDPLAGGLVLFGGQRPLNGSCASDEAQAQQYQFDGSVNLLPPSGGSWSVVAPRLLASFMTVDVGVNLTVNSSGYLSKAPPSVVYDGLPGGCFAGSTTVIDCRPAAAGNLDISASIYATGGSFARASVSVRVNGPPTVTISVNASEVILGTPISIVAVVAGGTPQYTFGFTGLPEGCPARNASSVLCTPSSSGSYNLTVEVRDRFGLRATAGVALNVVPHSLPPPSKGHRNALWVVPLLDSPLGLVLYGSAPIAIGAGFVGATRRRRRRLRRECEELVRELEGRIG